MRRLWIGVFFILTTVCLVAAPFAADTVTLVGEVNDNQQIVADNEIYEVEHNAAGDDLVLNYVAQKVKVVGQLKVVGQSDGSDEYKLIKVESFEVVEE
ncbi:MAG: hypothetical protein V2I56_18855 [Desulfobacteraceae bacterium]|jgi:hypothetical protein|nr:hypothetical protein [Desulfobacteraceae bacterium]